MQLKQWIRLAGAALGLVASFGASASAQTPCEGGPACNGCAEATMTVSDFRDEQAPPWMKVLSVSAFDTSLGRLAKGLTAYFQLAVRHQCVTQPQLTFRCRCQFYGLPEKVDSLGQGGKG